MTPSSKPLQQGGYDELRPASATDCLWTLFGLIPISSGNTLQGALQKAIAAGGGDALIQVTADSFYQHFIVVARSCTQVEGVGARSRGASAPPLAPPPLAPAPPPLTPPR